MRIVPLQFYKIINFLTIYNTFFAIQLDSDLIKQTGKLLKSCGLTSDWWAGYHCQSLSSIFVLKLKAIEVVGSVN